MKKKKVLVSRIALVLFASSLVSCVASVRCISHIDGNNDGKCDHCGQKMEIQKETDIEKIEVSVLPSKTYYALDEALDLTGGILTVTYKDGKPEKEIPLTDKSLTISKPNMSSKGKKLVGISYEGMKTSFTIEVGDKRFVVSFDLGYDGAEKIESQNVVIKGHATKPADPIREGYDFGGWYKESSCTNIFDFMSDEIMSDTTIFAKWYKQYEVIFKSNYSEGEDIVSKTKLGKVPSDVVPKERANYRFTGWYEDEGCTKLFDFNKEITENVVLFAKWVSENVEFHTIIFDENYGEQTKTTTTKVADGELLSRPTNPTRANVTEKGHQAQNFQFKGWYKDKEGNEPFDFSSAVSADMTLYAGWTGQYIFEAEHVSFIDEDTGMPIQGMGASGGSEGANMVDSPAPGTEGINASNGYYVTYLFAPFLTLTFNIDSDRPVNDAKLTFRITCEKVGYALSPTEQDGETENHTPISNYMITCNGSAIDYPLIEVSDVNGHEDTGGRRPFSDHVLTTSLNLKKGQNKFKFISSNDHGMGGTMSATAPVIDCIKIDTKAELSWDPITSNEFGQ